MREYNSLEISYVKNQVDAVVARLFANLPSGEDLSQTGKKILIIDGGGTISLAKNADGKLEPKVGFIQSFVTTDAKFNSLLNIQDNDTNLEQSFVAFDSIEVDKDDNPRPDDDTNPANDSLYHLPDLLK